LSVVAVVRKGKHLVQKALYLNIFVLFEQSPKSLQGAFAEQLGETKPLAFTSSYLLSFIALF